MELNTNVRTARRIMDGLRPSDTISRVEYLREGYSADRKYVIWIGDEPRYLLRLSDISEEPRGLNEHSLLTQLYAGGVACPEPMDFGVSQAEGVCFTLLSYIPGGSARRSIPCLSTEQQYEVGLSAGRELRKMHGIPTPQCTVDWYAFRSGRYEGYKREAAEMGISYEGREAIEAFITDHLPLMKNRPTTFRHGDYHPGNLIVRDGELAGVIDFNRCGWGDPYFEFYKVAQFGAPLSHSFACGQIDGYFSEGIPSDFWPLYNLYVAMVLTVDLVWTQHYFPNEMAKSHKLNQKIINTHDFASVGPPKWYAPR